MTGAITDTRPLTRSLRLRPGLETDEINTISDAAVFIIRLSKEKHDLLHWKLAGAFLQEASAAPNDDDLLRRTTVALMEALRADELLLEESD
jgi:hypothetical protein